MRNYITLLIKHRFPVLAVIFIVTAIWGAIALQGVMASSIENIFFGKDHAGFQAYKQRIREFVNDEVFIVIYKNDELVGAIGASGATAEGWPPEPAERDRSRAGRAACWLLPPSERAVAG